MKIKFPNFNGNVVKFVRDCGYQPISQTDRGELNCVKSLAGQDYPRFHCYLKKEGEDLLINMHLDQKKPSYGGETAHSGEYEGETIEAEARRIRLVLAKSV